MSSAPNPRFISVQTGGAVDDLVARTLTGTPRGHIVAIVLGLPAGLPVFAIVSGKGLLEAHHPVPWWILEHCETSGFTVPLDDDEWRRAPSHPPEATIDWNDEGAHRRIHGFYEQRRKDRDAADAKPAIAPDSEAVRDA